MRFFMLVLPIGKEHEGGWHMSEWMCVSFFPGYYKLISPPAANTQTSLIKTFRQFEILEIKYGGKKKHADVAGKRDKMTQIMIPWKTQPTCPSLLLAQ